jgi:ribosomal protein S1
MNPGDRVNAVVARVEVYGLYLEHAGSPILVLTPDVSTKRPVDLRSTFAVGDRLAVRILRYVPEASLYKATVVEDPETEQRSAG